MSLKVIVTGDKLDLADELEERFHEEALEAIGEAGQMLTDAVRAKLQARRGTSETVSPPGQPPEFDTGALLRSIRRIRPRVRGAVASSGVQSADPGANRLEFGMTDLQGRRTLPRPFVRPAMEQVADPVTRLLNERL